MQPSNLLAPGRRLPIAAWCLALAVLLVFFITIAITWGAVYIAPSTVWRIAGIQVLRLLGFDLAAAPAWPAQQFQIVWMIRMPRVLLAALVGAGLAVVGVVMQAMVRNPLADPYLLGVSSGASVGAVSVLAYGALMAVAGTYALTAGAFAGALVATLVVYALAQVQGRIHATRLILSGVAVGYVLVGITSLITLTSGQRELAAALMTWTLGTLAGTEWRELGLPTVVLTTSLAWLLLQARAMNAMSGGEETAVTLGVNTHDMRRRLFVVVSLVTGTMVAVSGAIGFIGLVIPHIARMLVGTNHRRVLPVAALGGAIFLVLVDLVARTWLAPTEIPAGVVTSLIGGPFFVWMLVRHTGFGGRST